MTSRVNVNFRCPHSSQSRVTSFLPSEKKMSSSKKRKVMQLDEEAVSSSDGDFLQKIKKNRIAAAASVMEFKFNKKRVRVLSSADVVPDTATGIVYWMSRDQRVQDNWAMLYAQKLAMKNKIGLHVVFCLVPKFLDATIRHYKFLLKGLQEVQQECQSLGIEFHLLIGQAQNVLPTFVNNNQIGAVVTDFSPLRVPMKWVQDVKNKLPDSVPLCQVDAHNIVPCWVASDKQEYAARTIRGKITSKLPEFLTHFPPVVTHPYPAKVKSEPVDWCAAEESLEVNRTVDEVDWAVPGTQTGLLQLEDFCKNRLKLFASKRNDPTVNALSNLSPWFHFGQLSVQRAALVVKGYKKSYSESVDSFLEEAIVRRELADNFCFYNKHYDNLEGASSWAKETLKKHKSDKRSYVYSCEQLEESKTHDDLWNSAQIQLVREGKMHGFLRMYWAKKILEWTTTPEDALQTAIYLNDKYNLDGRDPNGYVGCMWSVCGVHDQGWAEREIFGKIRYMNYQGCKRKFDVAEFVTKYGGRGGH